MEDFIVIGGGIAGVSAGARLSELGRVAVLEREDALAYHASGRSAALFEENYGKPSTVALNRASRAYHESADGGVLSPRGLMVVAGPEEEESFAADLAELTLEPLTPAEARAMVPILNPERVDRAGYAVDAMDIDTDRLIQHFARTIRAYGGTVRTGARVSGIARMGSGWAVETGDETIEGRMLVNAAGAWVDVVAEMAGIAPLGFTPMRRSMARLPAPGGHDVSGWPMVFGTGETWYAKPDAGALLVSPADEDPSAPIDAWADDMVLAEGLARYEAHVTEPVTRLLANWAGLRTFSPDRQLVLGPSPDDPAFIWCAGQGGYGFQSAPAASLLLADIVGGRVPEIEPEIVAALRPERFG